MHISKSIIGLFALVCLANISYAQPTESTPEMSAEDYKNMVNTLGQQNQNNLSNQVNQQFGPDKPSSSPPPAPVIAQPVSPPPVATTVQPIVQPTVQPTTPPVAIPTPAPPPITPTVEPVSPPVAVPVPQPAQAPVTTPTIAPPQSQSYTGFDSYGKPKNTGTSTTPSSGSSSEPKKSSGWNIQY